MIVPLTRAVIEQVCNDIAQMGDALPGFPGQHQPVGGQFPRTPADPHHPRGARAGGRRAAVADRVRAHRDGADARSRLAHRHLAQPREMGIRVAVDDFGTGYSSLAYLRRLAVNGPQDRSQLHRRASTTARAAIVEAVIGLARSLGMDVVAGALRRPPSLRPCATGCHLIQGYLFARPMARARP